MAGDQVLNRLNDYVVDEGKIGVRVLLVGEGQRRLSRGGGEVVRDGVPLDCSTVSGRGVERGSLPRHFHLDDTVAGATGIARITRTEGQSVFGADRGGKVLLNAAAVAINVVGQVDNYNAIRGDRAADRGRHIEVLGTGQKRRPTRDEVGFLRGIQYATNAAAWQFKAAIDQKVGGNSVAPSAEQSSGQQQRGNIFLETVHGSPIELIELFALLRQRSYRSQAIARGSLPSHDSASRIGNI